MTADKLKKVDFGTKTIIIALIGIVCMIGACSTTTTNGSGSDDNSLTVFVDVPSFTSKSNDYAVDAWKFPIKIEYSLEYNASDGTVSGVEQWHTVLTGEAKSPSGQGMVTSLNYETADWDIAEDGTSITCKYIGTATILYSEIPGEAEQFETVLITVSGSETVEINP